MWLNESKVFFVSSPMRMNRVITMNKQHWGVILFLLLKWVWWIHDNHASCFGEKTIVQLRNELYISYGKNTLPRFFPLQLQEMKLSCPCTSSLASTPDPSSLSMWDRGSWYISIRCWLSLVLPLWPPPLHWVQTWEQVTVTLNIASLFTEAHWVFWLRITWTSLPIP